MPLVLGLAVAIGAILYFGLPWLLGCPAVHAPGAAPVPAIGSGQSYLPPSPFAQIPSTLGLQWAQWAISGFAGLGMAVKTSWTWALLPTASIVFGVYAIWLFANTGWWQHTAFLSILIIFELFYAYLARLVVVGSSEALGLGAFWRVTLGVVATYVALFWARVQAIGFSQDLCTT